jgi:alanine dehydrogenase
MIIGVPKEIKNHEYRVGLTPASVKELVLHGNEVLVETQAGCGIGCSDDVYHQAGAVIESSAASVFQKADLIVKVKEPLEPEFGLIRANQTLFTFLHLAPDPKQADALVKSGCTAIAYETVTDHFGGHPLLAPMSEVAGKMSIQVGAHFLEKAHGGCGALLGGTSSVLPSRVVIIGGGVAGSSAARVALGMGATVTLFDNNTKRLFELNHLFQGRLKTLYPTHDSIQEAISQAHVVVGAVLVGGDKAPKVITREMLKKMRKRSVLVDISIDQGGCFETSRPTSHQDPIYVEEDIIHYCVTNMPGAVPHTSAFALNSATLPHVLKMTKWGVEEALRQDVHLKNGLNVYKGKITHKAVAVALNRDFVEFS